MATDQSQQCKAITEAGERCSRPADEDGFCHQHGPEDETIDEEEASTDEEEASTKAVSPDGGEQAAATDADPEAFDELLDQVRSITGDILGHPLDTVTSVRRDDDGWVVTVQVIERESIPDTQDILGEYRITFDESISPVGYERTNRYRRDQMDTAA